MRKGQRPSKHVRRVHTRNGSKNALVNPSIRKRVRVSAFKMRTVGDMGYRELREKKGINLHPKGDADGDGVPNKYDCRPLNKYKQDDDVDWDGWTNDANDDDSLDRSREEWEAARERANDLAFAAQQGQVTQRVASDAENDARNAREVYEAEKKRYGIGGYDFW